MRIFDMKHAFLILMLFLCTSLFAQVDTLQVDKQKFFARNDISVEVGGGSSALFDYRKKDLTFGNLSYNFRVLVDNWIDDKWAIVYGAQFSKQGMSDLIEEDNKQFFSYHNYYYVGIPIMARWHVVQYDMDVLSFSAGFCPDFLVNARERYKNFDVDHTRNIKDRINKVDCKFILDASYTLDCNMTFGVVGEIGLCRVGNTKVVYKNYQPNRNASIFFYVGYRFKKKQHKR